MQLLIYLRDLFHLELSVSWVFLFVFLSVSLIERGMTDVSKLDLISPDHRKNIPKRFVSPLGYLLTMEVNRVSQ